MAAMFKVPACDGAVVRTGRASPAKGLRAPAVRVNAPTAVLAHGTSDRFRVRLEGRQAAIYLQLAASEIAPNPDVFRIRINRASSSLVLWVRLGSELDGDGERVLALVSDVLLRIALGRRSAPAPIETARDDALGLGLSVLKAVAL